MFSFSFVLLITVHFQFLLGLVARGAQMASIGPVVRILVHLLSMLVQIALGTEFLRAQIALEQAELLMNQSNMLQDVILLPKPRSAQPTHFFGVMRF